MGREVRKVPADAEITYRYLTAAMKMRLKSSLAWRTVFFSNGERRHIGVFDSAEDAAKAYDDAAKSEHGEYAMTNKRAGLL